MTFDAIDWQGVLRSNRLIDWQAATAEVVRRVAERTGPKPAVAA